MKKKRILFAILLVAVVAVIGYNYLYQDHRDIKNEAPIAELSAVALLNEFKESVTNEFLNSTLHISGVVTEIDGNNITIDNKVVCNFLEVPEDLKLNKSIIIKGRCIGYDDLFEVVKLDQCSVVN